MDKFLSEIRKGCPDHCFETFTFPMLLLWARSGDKKDRIQGKMKWIPDAIQIAHERQYEEIAVDLSCRVYGQYSPQYSELDNDTKLLVDLYCGIHHNLHIIKYHNKNK